MNRYHTNILSILSDSLHNYRLTDNNICKNTSLCQEEIINSSSSSSSGFLSSHHPIGSNNISAQKNFFIPEEDDTLFWCFYIAYVGEDKYEFQKKDIFITEKEFKIQSIEKLRKIKPMLKINKIKLAEVEDELLNKKKITLQSLLALSILYECNFIYIQNRTYYEYQGNYDNPIFIFQNINDRFALMRDNSEVKLCKYRQDLWRIENIYKPIRGFSYYSLKELKKIASKLQIVLYRDENTQTLKTKKNIYEEILQRI